MYKNKSQFQMTAIVKTPSKVAGGIVAALAVTYAIKKMQEKKPEGKTTEVRTNRVGVNANFIRQIKWLLPICIPKVFCKESGLLLLLATVLIARTWLDIWFTGFNAAVVRSIVSRDRKGFIYLLIYVFGLMMWPMSAVNNSLKWTISSLAIQFRKRLTTYAHDQYLNGITFYKIANIDNRIQNADQLLTQDIDKFSDSLSHLYSDIAKPLVDIFLFAYKLGQAIGPGSPMYMIVYFVSSAAFLKYISPPFGKCKAVTTRLFRHCSRTKTGG
jgi:ATP-binding cassette subfamily D (ALD) protein 3